MTNRDRHSNWLDAHWRSAFLVFVGVVVGAAVGWWLGSWTSCGNACEPRVSAIEAVGTWVGGLGTVGAVGFAVIAFRAEERERRAAEVQRRDDERIERERLEESARLERVRLEQEEAAAFKRDEKMAALVTIECKWGSTTDTTSMRFDSSSSTALVRVPPTTLMRCTIGSVPWASALTRSRPEGPTKPSSAVGN